MVFGTGLPVGTLIALLFIISMPVMAGLLNLIDRSRSDSFISVMGRR